MKGMVAQEEQHFAAIEFTYLVSICRSPLQTVTLSLGYPPWQG